MTSSLHCATLLAVAGVVSGDDSAPIFQLDKLPPNVNTLLMNIGTNIDPLLPPDNNESVAVLAVEPLMHSRIRPRPRLYVMPAAVAPEGGVTMMDILHTNGVSSSLAAPAHKAFWTRSHGVRVVPVVAFRELLASVPSRIQLLYIRTDMQGYDYATLRSVGSQLRRVPYITAETWFANQFTYRGLHNDFCDDLLPFMLGLGYVSCPPLAPCSARGCRRAIPHSVCAARGRS
jgi:hypothetical protein